VLADPDIFPQLLEPRVTAASRALRAHAPLRRLDTEHGPPALAERFVAFLLSPDGRRILRRQHFDALDRPTLVGRGAPTGIGALAASR
jgi:hypothetical protein